MLGQPYLKEGFEHSRNFQRLSMINNIVVAILFIFHTWSKKQLEDYLEASVMIGYNNAKRQ